MVVDRLSGKRQPAHIFVAVLGTSSLVYAEASWIETLPDNAKVAVIPFCLYEPYANSSYPGMAARYDSTVLPTRPRRPRYKHKVEACAQC